jgi:hypothetical protein
MPFTESLADFYDDTDFSTAGSYTPAGGGSAVAVKGIFDTEYVEPFSEITGSQIAYRTWASQYASRPTKNATLAIAGTTYRIKNVQDIPPNGAEIRLMLEKTS